MKTLRPLPSRVASALICLWATLLSIQLPIAGCAHVPVDGDVADPAARRGLGLAAVPEGTTLRVTLRDGTLVQGLYAGIGQQASDAYATAYEAWRGKDPQAGWPALGDSVRLVSGNEIVRMRRFEGFDWGAVRVHAGAGTDVIAFDDLHSMSTASGKTFTAAMLSGLHDGGALPLAGTLKLRTNSKLYGTRGIPLDDIGSLQVQRGSNWVTAAVVIGMLGVVAIVIATRPKAEPRTGCEDVDVGGFTLLNRSVPSSGR